MTEASQQRRYSTTYAKAYVAGVADQTRGKRWCTTTGVLPHELGDRVYTYFSRLPKARLADNASTLVAEALAASFPCPRQSSGP